MRPINVLAPGLDLHVKKKKVYRGRKEEREGNRDRRSKEGKEGGRGGEREGVEGEMKKGRE